MVYPSGINPLNNAASAMTKMEHGKFETNFNPDGDW